MSLDEYIAETKPETDVEPQPEDELDFEPTD